MIDPRTEIPLEDVDPRVRKGKYTLYKTGGYHPMRGYGNIEIYNQPVWPYIAITGGPPRKSANYRKHPQLSGCISITKPYVNYTVDSEEGMDSINPRRRKRIKVYYCLPTR